MIWKTRVRNQRSIRSMRFFIIYCLILFFSLASCVSFGKMIFSFKWMHKRRRSQRTLKRMATSLFIHFNINRLYELKCARNLLPVVSALVTHMEIAKQKMHLVKAATKTAIEECKHNLKVFCVQIRVSLSFGFNPAVPAQQHASQPAEFKGLVVLSMLADMRLRCAHRISHYHIAPI